MKNLFLIVSILALASCVHAQGFDLGGRVGANIANFHLSSSEISVTPKTGIAIGLQADYWLNATWALSGQILYVQKGAKSGLPTTVIGGGTATITSVQSDDYIEIPLEAKFCFSDNGIVRPYIFAGIEIGILLSANVTSNNPSDPNEPLQTQDIKNETASTDFGIIGGAGLDFIIGSGTTIFVDAGYDFGLTNIGKSDFTNTVNTRDIRLCAGIVSPI